MNPHLSSAIKHNKLDEIKYYIDKEIESESRETVVYFIENILINAAKNNNEELVKLMFDYLLPAEQYNIIKNIVKHNNEDLIIIFKKILPDFEDIYTKVSKGQGQTNSEDDSDCTIL